MAIYQEMPDYPAQLVVIKSFVTKPLELTSPTLQVNSFFPSSPSIIPHSHYPASSTLSSYDEDYESYDDDSDMDDDDDTRSVFSDCGSVISSVSSAPEDEAEPFQVIDYSSGYAVPVMVYASLEQAVRLSTQHAEAEARRQEALMNEVHTVPAARSSFSPQQSQLPPGLPADAADWTSPGATSIYADGDEDEDAFFSMG
ncbi:uncharacterized protein PG998_002188 [Apiospora kogelbergensis]|uniref:Uncharacterized protein n=1 Tax=Apiospora kogelbergensis TaxID=1337665 RepID=A0AAW0QFT8_9PEZI